MATNYIIVYKKWLPYLGNSDERGFVSRRFSTSHKAIDSVGNYNTGTATTPVHAIFDGDVKTYYDPGYGYCVEITNNNLKVRYCHLSKNTTTQSYVKKGDIVGYESNSGSYATGKHLHTQLYINGTMVDPELYLGTKIELPMSGKDNSTLLKEITNAAYETYETFIQKVTQILGG